jgi:twitching motility protein PilI
MSKRISIKEFQASLSEKLESASMAQPVATVLGVLVGSDRWFVHMTDVNEVLQMPKITPVPLTHSWFLGIANVQGNLYGIADLAAYFGGASTPVEQKSRILLVPPRLEVNCGLLVRRTLGIRNVTDFERVDDGTHFQIGAAGIYKDKLGQQWKELNLRDLVRDEEFLQVAA